MKLIDDLRINVNDSIINKIPLDGLLVLYCVLHNKEDLLNEYIRIHNKINTGVLTDLIDRGYLLDTGTEKRIFFKNLSITDKFLTEFNLKETTNFEDLFKELVTHFPKIVPVGRRLLGDKATCKALYKKILINDNKIDLELHKLIIKCLDYELNERQRSGNLKYLQALVTWLRQKTYDQYVEDVIKGNGDINPYDVEA